MRNCDSKSFSTEYAALRTFRGSDAAFMRLSSRCRNQPIESVTVVTDAVSSVAVHCPHHEPLGREPLEERMSYLMYPFAIVFMMFGGMLASV